MGTLPSFLLEAGGARQDSHIPTRVPFYFLLGQLTVLEGASWLPGAQEQPSQEAFTPKLAQEPK